MKSQTEIGRKEVEGGRKGRIHSCGLTLSLLVAVGAAELTTGAVTNATPQIASSLDTTTQLSLESPAQNWHPQSIVRVHFNAQVDSPVCSGASRPCPISQAKVGVDAPIEDFHGTLMDSGYAHPAIQTSEKQPTVEDALENTDSFEKGAAAAWEAIGNGHEKAESRVNFTKYGQPGTIFKEPLTFNGEGHQEQNYSPAAAYLMHTHSNTLKAEPSDADKEAAIKSKRTIYVVSSRGLFSVDPTGKVTQVFDNPNWMSQKRGKK